MGAAISDRQAAATPPVNDMHASRMAELERLLNDPDVPIRPDRVWWLVFEIAQYERAALTSSVAA